MISELIYKSVILKFKQTPLFNEHWSTKLILQHPLLPQPSDFGLMKARHTQTIKARLKKTGVA